MFDSMSKKTPSKKKKNSVDSWLESQPQLSPTVGEFLERTVQMALSARAYMRLAHFLPKGVSLQTHTIELIFQYLHLQGGKMLFTKLSPGRSPLHGNLTGLARKIKDCCADWHNVIQKWKIQNNTGMVIIGEISNLKIQSIPDVDLDDGLAENCHTMPDGLEELCQKLLQVTETMDKLVDKMEALTASLKGVGDLEYYQQNQSFCEDPFFLTWTTDTFYETSKDLLAMYQKELALKKTVAQNVAHARKRDNLMFYTATWLHEPYIEDQAELLLESLLTECCHR